MNATDYAALGRIEGAAHARAAMIHCREMDREQLVAAQQARIALLVKRAAELRDAGATVEECDAFLQAADGRFYEALGEIVEQIKAANAAELAQMAAELPPIPPRPPSRAERRRAKAERRKMH